MDACNLTHEARAMAARTWQCSGCNSPKPGSKSIDVHLQQVRIKDGPLNLVTCGLGLVYTPFLEQLGWENVERDLHLGRAINYKGKLVDDWVTFNPRRRVIVRGSDDPKNENSRAGYRICVECGRTLYGAYGTPYLFPGPPADAEIIGKRTSTLIIPDYLFFKLEIPNKAKIAVDRLEVLGEPLDGFGVLEPWEPDRSRWGVRHQSMRGYTRLTDSVLRQGKRDVEAMNNGYYHSVYWHFFPDAETGRIELAPDLLEAMERSGIEYVLHGGEKAEKRG
jgi:hypothetical protein